MGNLLKDIVSHPLRLPLPGKERKREAGRGGEEHTREWRTSKCMFRPGSTAQAVMALVTRRFREDDLLQFPRKRHLPLCLRPDLCIEHLVFFPPCFPLPLFSRHRSGPRMSRGNPHMENHCQCCATQEARCEAPPVYLLHTIYYLFRPSFLSFKCILSSVYVEPVGLHLDWRRRAT